MLAGDRHDEDIDRSRELVHSETVANVHAAYSFMPVECYCLVNISGKIWTGGDFGRYERVFRTPV